MIHKTKLVLIKAIMNNDPVNDVTKLFNNYLNAYAEERTHSSEELMDYGRMYSMYLGYLGREHPIVRDIENKRDIAINYKEEDKGKDYFEHLNPNDIPK